MPPQPRLRPNRSQNAAASILASAKPKSKDRRTKPDFGKTELIMPPKPLQRQSRPQNVADTPSKSLRQNRTQKATAPSPIWAKPSSKCRGIKTDFGKTKHKMPRRQAQLGKTKHKMPPKPRLRWDWSQNAAQTPYPAKHPTEFKRLNPDCRKTKVKMSTKSSI